jgi:homoserine dehydrogenase
LNIALLGLGVVGRGVYDILSTAHKDIVITKILEKDKSKLNGITQEVIDDFNDILNDQSIDTVVELIGGKGVAYTFIKQALMHNKHVVTANKAVISDYYHELKSLAQKHNVTLRYEASVGGGIIVLNPLSTLVEVNPITSIKGIINGSTNFILSKIFLEDYSADQAFQEALSLGFIETGSTDDMDGIDLLRKINILSMMAYRTNINESDILIEPLSRLTERMIKYVKKQNKIVKYIGVSSLKDDEVKIYLTPVALDKTNPLASIHYEQNMIVVEGMYHEWMAFKGLGAGRYPTASAVVYDLVHLNNQVPFDASIDASLKAINTSPVKGDYLVERTEGITHLKNQALKPLLKDDTILCLVAL